jgi:hypothetical protein
MDRRGRGWGRGGLSRARPVRLALNDRLKKPDTSPTGIVLSDATPDPIRPGAQYAQLRDDRQYSVDLAEEEAPRGIGHAIRRHVGKSDEALIARLNQRWQRYETANLEITEWAVAEGSFESLMLANDFVNQVLKENRNIVDTVAGGDRDRATLERRFGYPIGKEAFRTHADDQPRIRTTYGVRVLIIHDSGAKRGYAVRTAFPVNETLYGNKSP